MEFDELLQAHVPQVFYDPALIRVRHNPPMPLYVKLLVSTGLLALGGLLALILFLFCKYRRRTTTNTTIVVPAGTTAEDQEMCHLNPPHNVHALD